jgi:hypothetical protein
MGLALHTQHVRRGVDGVVQRERDGMRLAGKGLVGRWLEWHRLRLKAEGVGCGVDVSRAPGVRWHERAMGQVYKSVPVEESGQRGMDVDGSCGKIQRALVNWVIQ